MPSTGLSNEVLEVAAVAAATGIGPINALAAVVERPVAVASAERGPANGISGEPYDVTGLDI